MYAVSEWRPTGEASPTQHPRMNGNYSQLMNVLQDNVTSRVFWNMWIPLELWRYCTNMNCSWLIILKQAPSLGYKFNVNYYSVIIPPLVKHSDSILVYSVGSCCLLFLSSYLKYDKAAKHWMTCLNKSLLVTLFKKNQSKNSLKKEYSMTGEKIVNNVTPHFV